MQPTRKQPRFLQSSSSSSQPSQSKDEDFDAADDVAKSFDEAYRVIRERMANGGPGWTPKDARLKALGGEMSDIVRRLRVETDRICSEAADEIERLRAIEWRKQAQHWESEVRSCRAILFEKDAEIERLTQTLEDIEAWSRAYPLAIFPEPDLKKAHELLKAGGMTLDAISAHAMRHVITQVGETARKALEGK